MAMRSKEEVDAIMQEWRDWFASTGAPEALAAQRVGAPREIRGDGLDLAITCDACPVQIAGTVDGAHLYFRARSGEWRCAIAADEDTATTAGRFSPAEGALYYAEGEDDEDGWMAHAEAWRIVGEAVAAFRAREGR